MYYRHFGKALKQDIFSKLVKEMILDAASKKSAVVVESHDYYKYKISYTTSKEHELMFLFVTSLTDSFDDVKKELLRCKKEFLNLFSDILLHKFDAKTFEILDPTIDSIHRNLRPKVSLVGFSGVGKTTITKLIKAEEIPMEHIPTITGDIATIKIGKLYFHLWDFAGQEQFSYLWNNFVKGSDAVLLITDSTLENVEKSKFFLELIKDEAPNAHTAVIGNKQDLPEALKVIQIEKILGLKTYSMIAKESKNRDKMIQIIADVLEMSAELSPLLKPLLQRDKLTEEAMKALENAEFNESALLFEKISDLCLELGDDSLGKEFYEKSMKIKEMLQKVGAPQQPPPPIKPQKVEKEDKKGETPLEAQERPIILPQEKSLSENHEASSPPTHKIKITDTEKIQIRVQEDNVLKVSKPISEETKKLEEQIEHIEPKKEGISEKMEKYEKVETESIESQQLEAEKVKLESKKAKKDKEKKKEKRFGRKKKKKESIEEIKSLDIKSVISKPSFLKQIEASESNQESKLRESPKILHEDKSQDLIKPDMDVEEPSWLHPKLKQVKEQKVPDRISELIKAEEEKQILIKPQLDQNKIGIEINPEDFIIKKQPTKVLEVPKDAKTKLKTSAYGHVSNEPEAKPPEPIAPIKLIKLEEESQKQVASAAPVEKEATGKLIKPVIPPAPIIPKELEEKESSETTISTEEPIQFIDIKEVKPEITKETVSKPVETQKTTGLLESKQLTELENSLMDLKIKKAKIQKMVLDFEMQELSGEITSEELKEKKKKVENLEKKINEQIQELNKILSNYNS